MIKRTLQIFWQILIVTIAKIDWLTSSKRNHVISIEHKYQDFKNVFVYVHWSKDLKPTIGEIALLKIAKKNGLQNFVVLNADNSHDLSQVKANWSGLYMDIVIRRNKGRDLAAYRCALQFLDISNINKIYFFNNSILWLPEQLDSFMKSFVSFKSGLYAATISHQPFPHMQSFALAAQGGDVVAITQAIKKIRNTKLKRSTILFGELKISRDLSHGNRHKSDAFFKYGDLMIEALNCTTLISQPRKTILPSVDARLNLLRNAAVNGQPLNPTHHLWYELYKSGFPGLKRDLISKNPSGIPDLIMLPQLLKPKDALLIDIDSLGFLTYSKSITTKIRRRIQI